MKYLIALLLLGLVACQLQAQDEEHKATHTFDPQQCHSIRINIPTSNITTKEWGHSKIKLYLTVKGNMPIEIMQLLEKRDRYTPIAHKEGDVLIIELPNIKKGVVVKGKSLEEELKVELVSPLDLSVYEDSSSLQLLHELGGRSGGGPQNQIPHPVEVDLQLSSGVQSNTGGILKHLQHGDILIDGEAVDLDMR